MFFENKDKFVFSDFEKLKEIKTLGNYSNSLNKMLADFNVSKIFYGIGIPANKNEVQKSLENIREIDFLVSTSDDKTVHVHYDKDGVFL